ncbi:hypothetical protein ACIQI8_09370 [Streptomyces sp. NPDC092369]|uniref:hypothetical protein n=1 Tax=Streptomyces sp. NPDC092369 TaxID=3366015 RepID=UPI00382E924E
MPDVKAGRALGILALTAALVTLKASSAWAGITSGDGSRETDTDVAADSSGDKVAVEAGAVVFDRSKNGFDQSAGPVASTTTWTPPACYYSPTYTPGSLKAYMERIWAQESTGYEWDASQRERYVNGHPYKDFNKENADKGYWWDRHVTPGREGDPASLTCSKSIFWVAKGQHPPADAPQAVTPKVLAELAYAEIRVPSTTVKLAPAGSTKVNLPTWAWLEAARFKPVSVTARVPLLGAYATATAEPVLLKIDPGTDDAVTYPASGECRLRADGSLGESYAKGKANETPPCGAKYLRSSGDGTYPLKATVTWKINWTGSGEAGGDLPDGTFGATQDVVVQEIQAVNR